MKTKLLCLLLFAGMAISAMAQHAPQARKIPLVPARPNQKRLVNGIKSEDLIKIEAAHLKSEQKETDTKLSKQEKKMFAKDQAQFQIDTIRRKQMGQKKERRHSNP